MAATFNAPLASVVLAVELLLFEWRPRSLVPVAAAVAVAAVVRQPLLGTGALFPSVGAFHVTSSTYLLCLVSGVISGLLAILATVMVYASEDAFGRLPIHWMWWPAIGGLVIGLGGLIVPEALGVGYDIIDLELTGSIGLGLVAGILVVKTLIWSFSLGSGTSGGVLAPIFMIGGALGSLESHVFPAVGPGFWALLGLAGVIGGVMRSPFTGVVFAMELTHRFDAILPLIVAAVSAFAVSVLLLKRSVLTEKIARRGYHLTREYDVDPLEILFVSEVMTDDVLEFGHDLTVAEALSAIGVPDDDGAGWRQRLYPVVGPDGGLRGVVTRRDLFSANTEGDGTTRLAELIRDNAVLTHEDQTLRHAAALMAEAEVSRIPVVDRADETRVVGIVTLSQLLAGRQRDQIEARERERHLRIRLAVPTLPGRGTRQPSDRATEVAAES
jgi:CBS domain-containing protein